MDKSNVVAKIKCSFLNGTTCGLPPQFIFLKVIEIFVSFYPSSYNSPTTDIESKIYRVEYKPKIHFQLLIHLVVVTNSKSGTFEFVEDALSFNSL